MNTIDTIREKTAQFKAIYGVDPNTVFVNNEAYRNLGTEANLKFPVIEALGMKVHMVLPLTEKTPMIGVGLCLDHPMEDWARGQVEKYKEKK